MEADIQTQVALLEMYNKSNMLHDTCFSNKLQHVSLGTSDSSDSQTFVLYLLECLLVYMWYWRGMFVFTSKLNYVHSQANPLKSFPNSAIFTTFLWGKHAQLLLPCEKRSTNQSKSKTSIHPIPWRIICLNSLPISDQAVCFCCLCFPILYIFHQHRAFFAV